MQRTATRTQHVSTHAHIMPSHFTTCDTMHAPHTPPSPLPHRPHCPSPTTHTHNQLNRHLNETNACISQMSDANATRTSQSKSRSAHYQPYGSGLGADVLNQSKDQNSRSLRSISNSRKTKASSPSADRPGANSNTDSGGLSACAVCLGRNPHDVAQCDAQVLWDGHTLAFAQKGDKGAKLRAARTSNTLCLDWNLPRTCGSSSHLARHRCSGCGNGDHGAQSCRLAQPRIQN